MGVKLDAASVAAGRLVVQDASAGPGNTTLLIGLAPDGNVSVTTVDATGAVRNVAVVNNVYYATSAAGFRSVKLKDSVGNAASYELPNGGS